jgi:capsule polysaccharide export protein KpsE/RkpR
MGVMVFRSFAVAGCFEHFFKFFDVNKVSVDYDDSTVIISIVTMPEEKADISAISTSYLNQQQQINVPLSESEMRDYLEEVTKEISKWRKTE